MLVCGGCGLSLRESRAGLAAHTRTCPRCSGPLTRTLGRRAAGGPGGGEDRHAQAVRLSLGWAADEARAGNFGAALQWLDTVLAVDGALPPGWDETRREWLDAHGTSSMR